MNQNEAIEKIISEPKFYIGKLPQSTASHFVASWRKGMSKQKTIDEFLQLFGYYKIKDAEYEKINPLDKYESGGVFHGQNGEVVINK